MNFSHVVSYDVYRSKIYAYKPGAICEKIMWANLILTQLSKFIFRLVNKRPKITSEK